MGPVIRFGVFEMNVSTGELRRSGSKVRLQGHPIAVLALLLEQPGQLVTREELQQRLWPADTFVDFEHNINEAVKRLRQALNDSAATPRFIETLPRRGYRFIYPVESEGTAVEQPIATPSRQRLVTLSAIILIGALALTIFYLWSRSGGMARSSKIDSLVVLPFQNLTGDPGQDYLVDGIADELTTELAGIKGLRVISRTSADYYRSAQKALPQIARELNVQAVVEGSVRRSGDRISINVQLIHGPTDRHLWAKTYERDARDVFTLQRVVASAIVREIGVSITEQERAQLAHKRTIDPRSYEAYLRGRHFWSQRTTEATLARAIESFNQAIKIDNQYAEPYAGLADCYTILQFYGPEDPRDSWPKAKSAALTALRLDDSLAEAHNALAVYLHRREWKWVESEKEFKRALELNPNYADGHRSYAIYLRTMSRFDDARRQIELARSLDPHSFSGTASVVRELYFARRYDRAVEQGSKQLTRDPGVIQLHYWMGISHAEKGTFPAAVEQLRKAIELSHRNSIYVAGLAYTYAKEGKLREARQLLGELETRSHQQYVPPYRFAAVYAALGETDKAFESLEKSYEERGLHLSNLGVDPMLDTLRSDARFESLLHRMGLPSQPRNRSTQQVGRRTIDRDRRPIELTTKLLADELGIFG
jgi:TolB-like protein/DNA-binding winged helix-turn-helix (wHTH) protein/Flp pilus assembly protein TadD